MDYQNLLDFLKDGVSFDVSIGNETFHSVLYGAKLKTASETLIRFVGENMAASISKHRINEIKIHDITADLNCMNNVYVTIKK